MKRLLRPMLLGGLVASAPSSDGTGTASPPNNTLAVVDLESGATQVLSFPTVPGLLLDPAWSR